MKLTSSDPFWPIQAGLPADYPRLTGDVRCDVAVIGAGITGALVAWHLSREGFATVVVDRRDVGHGSTSASTSLLQYEIDEPLDRLALWHGWDKAVRAFERCREAIDSIERLSRRLGNTAGFERKNSLRLASGKSHVARLRREFDARHRAGFPDQWWSHGQLRERSSLKNPAAILSPIGAQLNPYRFTYALLEASRQMGARICDRSEVVRRSATSRSISLKVAGGSTVRARVLVDATGYEADLHLPRRMTEWKNTFALITEPLSTFEGWPSGECLIWETRDPYVYLRTTPDRRAIIGGYDEDYAPANIRDRLLPKKSVLLARRFNQMFPAMKMEVAYSWAGTFARTADGLPWIGRHPELKNTWVALGYGGNGITFSQIAAEMIRDDLIGRKNKDSEVFGFGRAAHS